MTIPSEISSSLHLLFAIRLILTALLKLSSLQLSSVTMSAMTYPLLALLFFCTLPASSIFILLPLYVYPGTSASAWSAVFSAISAYPSVQWQIVINPNSGPGAAGSYPDSNYIYGVSQLNSYSNVLLEGYVDTAFTSRNINNVKTDINTYANWANCPSSTCGTSNISMAGIFFDDVTTVSNTTTRNYMKTVASYAYAQVPSDVTPVIFNPGTKGPTVFFSYCSTMVEFEDYYSNYMPTTISSLPAQYLDQSAIIIHDTPSSANIASLVHTMNQDGIEAVYFTSDCCYNAINATLLNQLAAAVQAG